VMTIYIVKLKTFSITKKYRHIIMEIKLLPFKVVFTTLRGVSQKARDLTYKVPYVLIMIKVRLIRVIFCLGNL